MTKQRLALRRVLCLVLTAVLCLSAAAANEIIEDWVYTYNVYAAQQDLPLADKSTIEYDAEYDGYYVWVDDYTTFGVCFDSDNYVAMLLLDAPVGRAQTAEMFALACWMMDEGFDYDDMVAWAGLKYGSLEEQIGTIGDYMYSYYYYTEDDGQQYECLGLLYYPTEEESIEPTPAPSVKPAATPTPGKGVYKI